MPCDLTQVRFIRKPFGSDRLLGRMSIFTMLMAIPQLLSIWIGHQAGGVSLLTWSTYFVSAVIRFWFGIRKGDKNIYLPYIG